MARVHSRRAERALAYLAETDPAFASLALWCQHRDDDGIQLAESDAITIRYGAGFERLSLAEQTGVAAHHILHIAFRHAPRGGALSSRLGGDFDPDLFNIAADAIVNEALQSAGYVLPRPFVTLGALMSQAFSEDDAGRGALARFDAERLYLRLRTTRPDKGKNGARRAGGAKGRAEGTRRLTAWAEGQGYRRDLAPGGPDGEGAQRAEEDADWSQRVARAMAQGRAAGRGIGMLARDIADIRPAVTPWDRQLRGLIARAVVEGPRLDPVRPSNRWLARDADARRADGPAPGFEAARLSRRATPRIAVGIDVSGSIDDGRLARFAAEIGGIGLRTGAEVHVMAFDDEVRRVVRLAGRAWSDEIGRLSFTGGGGTSFREVVATAEGLEASVAVILTDLDGTFGPRPRHLPVIWAVPDAAVAPMPPFGRVLDLAH
jgi:predicted metal-dependent peptidase